MSRAIRPVVRRRMAGLSLIELMVALVMALIVAAGIVTVFASTSSSNKAQAQMVSLQEEGRFAIDRLRTDLASANGMYCSNTGGSAVNTAAAGGSGLFLDMLRTPTVFSKDVTAINTAIKDVTRTYPAPTAQFALPSPLYMRGYDCTTSACTPVDPNTTVSTIPKMGTAVGDRVVGASILTLRYLRPGSGWAIAPSGAAAGSTLTAIAGNVVTDVNIKPMTGEPPASDFSNGDLMLLANCFSAGIYSVSAAAGGGGTATLTLTGNNYVQPQDISGTAAPRVFDFSKDFQTITYYLRVVCSDSSSPCDHTTGELVRRVNGVAQPLVRGVERLDFRYGVIDANGNSKFLTANELDTGVDGAGNAIACPPGFDKTLAALVDGMPGTTPGTGCLWRAVQTIEVHVLMDGQTPLYTLTPAEMNYVYTLDGSTVPTAPSAHTIKPKADQGFPEHLLRREFVSLVSLRNFNP